MTLPEVVSLLNGLFLTITLIGSIYWFVLAIASIREIPPAPQSAEFAFLAVAIPAMDEEGVIGQTLQSILQADYPRDRLDIYVVADHCTDATAEICRSHGAITHERSGGVSTDKGTALAWLFERIAETEKQYDGIVIFDADSIIHPAFFKEMNASLACGAQVVQGKHTIRNNRKGWFPALAWSMFIIDNRYQNQGRTNLGFSAKNMGDSICIHPDILWNQWLGSGLTEDYAFRQRLLLHGIKIQYNPRAIGQGEAPPSWHDARPQRARWLRGAYLASRATAPHMLKEGLRRHDLALLDGAFQGYLPSYSTLALIAVVFALISWIFHAWMWSWLPPVWTALVLLLFIYPFLGLALEKAPIQAYLVILTGPIFIVWRTILSIYARYLRRDLRWVRTSRQTDPTVHR
jgi:cellulose synthase/poly-beta-1,6-N-acetylglucosamine synthase-like glycosyltransferase